MKKGKKKLTLGDQDLSQALWTSLVVIGSTCQKKKKLNISIEQNIKRKKMYLGSRCDTLVLLMLP